MILYSQSDERDISTPTLCSLTEGEFKLLSPPEMAREFNARFPSTFFIRYYLGDNIARYVDRCRSGRVKFPSDKSKDKLWRLIDGDFNEEDRAVRVELYARRVRGCRSPFKTKRKNQE